MDSSDGRLMYFEEHILQDISLPERFTFPFYYEPHPLALHATEKLMHDLETRPPEQHNFGLSPDGPGPVIGKMFGVLVVKDRHGKVGYLYGFSGKLAGTNRHERFVPPVFDMLTENSFFLREEEILNSMNRRIEEVRNDREFLQLQEVLAGLEEKNVAALSELKEKLKENKEKRRLQREAEKRRLSPEEYALVEEELVRQSLADKRLLAQTRESYRWKEDHLISKITEYEAQIEALVKERRRKSAALQEELFSRYVFLNQYGVAKGLGAIFRKTVSGKPPAAAGECATPKLLQYAFQQGYTPLAMAEFWWGAPPRSEVRKHRQFYPACTGKCEPILQHMLEGIPLDDNPLLHNPGREKEVRMLYEDEHFVVVHKPSGLLSVPGTRIEDSVFTRLRTLWNGRLPFMVHRLDMSTSGLLVVARTKEAHKHIQRQFLKRTVIKRYTALLTAELAQSSGEIHLPLRPDLDDRPRQLVCFEQGKKAITRWELVSTGNGQSKVHFYPLTGRTHQLRVHAAHPLGLNAPIAGDDLYGSASDRLYLHAARLEFTHPGTKERMRFECAEEF